MDRSGRLFSFGISSSVTGEQEKATSNLPVERSQHYLNFASNDVSLKLKEAARADPDFIDVILATSLYGIPEKTIDIIGVEGSDSGKQVISIGAGLTAEVVQHMFDQQQTFGPDRFPHMTVALKIFRSTKRNSPSEAKAARQKVYDSILREMKAFGHRSLSNHPHILKLLFVGWSTNHAYPLLAMELGEHGSLDYIIRTPGPGRTTRQKRNLTIDIALGLQAIHKAGFTHGDLKPDNIIVFSSKDPARQVIAKLTDFGGSDQLHGEQSAKPTHFTPLWSAPEVLEKRAKFSWNRADVYSYGLIVASLWAGREGNEKYPEGIENHDHYDNTPSKGMFPSSSVLFDCASLPSDEEMSSDEDIPSDEHMPSNEGEEGLKYLKSLPESHPYGLMSVLAKRITRESLPADIDPSEVFAILTPTLRTNWRDRLDTDDLMVVISQFSNTIGRAIDPLVKCEDSEIYEPTPIRDLVLNRNVATYLLFTDLRDIIISHAVRALDEINDRMKYKPQPADIPGQLPEDLSTDQFLASLLTNTENNLRNLYTAMKSHSSDDIWSGVIDFIKKGYFLCDLGLIGVHCLEGDQALDLKKRSLEYIRTSALYENQIGLMTASYALSTGSATNQLDFPVRLNLTLLALSHSSLAIRRLHSNWPDLYAMVCKVMRERGLRCLEEAKKIYPGLYATQRLVWAYVRAAPSSSIALTPLSLGEALEIGATERIREILESDHAITRDQEQSIRTLFHKLSKVPDVEAAGLARIAYERGASLDCPAEIDLTDTPSSGSFQFSSMPLSAAIGRGQPKLAFEIFCLHVEFDVPIREFSSTIFGSFANLYPEVGEALLRLFQDNPAMCLDLDAETIQLSKVNGDFMTLGLPQIMVAPIFPLTNLISLELHGGGYEAAYMKTLNFLLNEGADPTLGGPNRTPLGFSIVADDITALKLFINQIEMIANKENRKSVSDVLLASMIDPCNLASVQYTVCGSTAAELSADWEYIHTALALCVRHGSLRCFELLLEKVPSLVNVERDMVGRTLLHRACSGVEREVPNADGHPHSLYPRFMELIARAGRPGGPGVEFVELLLKAGADVLATDSRGSTPLYWALRRVNIAAADMIASHCSRDQLNHLLRRDPGTGDSIFGNLVETDVEDRFSGIRRDPRLVKSLRWLQERGAAHFQGRDNIAVWNSIVASTRTLRIDQLTDATLMEYLIELPVFAEKVHTERYQGFSMLHLAVMNGNVEIVRLLLARQCDPNVVEDTAPGWKTSTPLDLIVFNLIMGTKLPSVEKTSHVVFIRQQDAMLDIANMLLDKGARGEHFEALQAASSALKGSDKEWEELIEKSRDSLQPVVSLNEHDTTGSWPIPLPPGDHAAVAPSVADAALLSFDPMRDTYPTPQTIHSAFERLIDRRQGRFETQKQYLLLEELHVKAARGLGPTRDSSGTFQETASNDRVTQ